MNLGFLTTRPSVSSVQSPVELKKTVDKRASSLDINKIIRCIGSDVCTDWYTIALELFDDGDQHYRVIRNDCSNAPMCFRKVLQHWKRKYPQRCTPEHLVKVLSEASSKCAATKLESEIKAGVNFFIDEFEQVLAEVHPLPIAENLNKWLERVSHKAMEIGYQLLSESDMNALIIEEHGLDNLMKKVIEKWRGFYPQKANCEIFLEALRSSEVGDMASAADFEKQFCSDAPVKNQYYESFKQTKDLLARIETLEKELAMWKKQFNRVQAMKDMEVSILKEKNETLNAELFLLKKNIDSGEIVKQKNREIDAFSKELSEQKKKVQNYQCEIGQKDAATSDLKDRINNISEERDSLKRKCDELQKRSDDYYNKRYKSDVENTTQPIQKENEKLKKELAKISEQLETVIHQRESIQTRLDASEQERVRLTNLIDNLISKGTSTAPQGAGSVPDVLLAKRDQFPEDVAIPSAARKPDPAIRLFNRCSADFAPFWKEIAAELGLNREAAAIAHDSGNDGDKCLDVFERWTESNLKANFLTYAQAVFNVYADARQPYEEAKRIYQLILTKSTG